MANDTALQLARASAVLSLCLSIAGCATIRSTAFTDLEPLAVALTEPLDELRRRADAGQAQYALAVLHSYGVRSVNLDPAQAAVLRRTALAARGYTPITTFIAGAGTGGDHQHAAPCLRSCTSRADRPVRYGPGAR